MRDVLRVCDLHVLYTYAKVNTQLRSLVRILVVTVNFSSDFSRLRLSLKPVEKGRNVRITQVYVLSRMRDF